MLEYKTERQESLQMKFPEPKSVRDDLVLKRPFYRRSMEKMRQTNPELKERGVGSLMGGRRARNIKGNPYSRKFWFELRKEKTGGGGWSGTRTVSIPDE